MDDQDSNIQVITIDSEISRILGLEDNFDLDPDEYLQLVREKLVQYDFLSGSGQLTDQQQEEQRILASKVREIREQKRSGNIKYTTGKVGKKISTDSFFNKKPTPEETKNKITDPSKLLPRSASVKTGEIVKYKSQKVEDAKVENQKEENKELVTINTILNSILDTLKNQFKFDQKKTEESRKEKESKKREKKESNLEKGFAMVKSAIKKMIAPFQSIIDQIIRYIFFTFLGKMFTDLMQWLSDPNNKRKVESLMRFLKDWWPLLLGAYLMFATPLGLFVRGTIKMVAGLTSQILKLLPRLLKVSKGLITSKPARAAGSALLNVIKSPFFWFPAAVAGTAALANEVTGQRKAAPVQAENKAKAQTGKSLGVQGTDTAAESQKRRSPSPGDMGPTTPYGLLQGARNGGIINSLRSFGNLVSPRGYSNGAEVVEDGYSGIDSDTGISITGAGRDTQLIAARPGEVVLTPEDVGTIQQKTGFDVYSFVSNRKPSYTNFSKIKTTGGIPLANMGGILGFNKGGIVGGKNSVNPQISLPDYYTLLAISALEDDKPQGRADVAQSIYNRLYAANKYKTNFSQTSNTLKSLIVAPQQYQPTFTNTQNWLAIKDKMSAAIAIMNSKKGRDHKWTLRDAMSQLSATESALKNPALQASAQKHVGGRAYFLGTSEQGNMKPGDVLRDEKHNFFSPWYLEGTPYDKERRNIAAPIPQMLVPMDDKNRGIRPLATNTSRVNKQNPFQRFISNIFNLASPPAASATPKSKTKKPKRWATDPRGWFGMQGGGEIPQGPFTPLPSPGYVRPQGSFIPKPTLRLPGPMPGSTVPFGFNPFKGLQGGGEIPQRLDSEKKSIQNPTINPLHSTQRFESGGMIGPSWMPWNWGKLVDQHRNAKPEDYENQKGLGANLARKRQMYKQMGLYQGGGFLMPVTTKTGIPTSKVNIDAGADTQYLPDYNVAVQPGEEIFKYVIPKDAAQRGAGTKLLQIAHQIIGDNDSNSKAAKLGFRNTSINIKPPVNRLNSTMMIPPVKTLQTGGMKGSAATNSQDVFAFNPVFETAESVRKMHVDMYGILD